MKWMLTAKDENAPAEGIFAQTAIPGGHPYTMKTGAEAA